MGANSLHSSGAMANKAWSLPVLKSSEHRGEAGQHITETLKKHKVLRDKQDTMDPTRLRI